MRKSPARARPLTRAIAVEKMRARLLREGFPRLQMLILVSLTGLAGFAASAALLAAGIDGMALRYGLAMGAAYIVFLLLLWLWLRTSASDYVDIPVYGGGGADGGTANAAELASTADGGFVGCGGTFDGGGASANVDFGADDSGGVVEAAKAPLEVIGGADEGTIPLAVILLALGIVLSSLFVVWSAPILFAEILVDALLAAGLYRRLRVLDQQHWMVAALKRTLIPFILTTLVVVACGWAMQAQAPQATSLGDVLESVRSGTG